MIRFSVPAVLLIASCTCGPPVEPQCTRFTMPFTTFLLTGLPATMDVSIWESCSGQGLPETFHKATSVAVEVLDPAGNPAPFTVSAVSREGQGTSFRNMAIVKFTPNAPGVWLVKARFDPDIGQLQQFIPAIDDLPSRVAWTVPAAKLPDDCAQVGVTAQGTVLCGHTPPNNTPGELVSHQGQKLVGAAFAVDGEALWGWNGSSRLTRYAEDAGTFVPSHSATAEMGTVARLGAAAGDLWVLTSSPVTSFETRLYRFHPEEDAGLSRTERRFQAGYVANGIAARADRVLLMGAVSFASSLIAVPDAGAPTITPLVAPEMGALTVVGADADSIWQVGLGALVGSDDAVPLRVGPNVTVLKYQPPVLWPYAPAVSTNIAIAPNAFPRIDGGTFWFETFHGAGHKPPFAATGTHAFAKSNDGQSIVVIDR